LVAAVANTYLIFAADRENLHLAQTTLDTQQASYELILRSRDAGIASDLDLRQAQSQVEAARVDIARYAGQVTLDENALNLLVGTPVATDLQPGELGSDQALKDVSPGLPSEVLLRRPDILSAEHQLKAAYANIGVARAEFFPQITLTGGGGFMTSHLADLFTGDSKTWTFAPQVVMPIFDAGARRANLKVSKVDRDLAVAEYDKAIQSAFREISDSLTLRTRLAEQQEAQQALVNALGETYRLSDARYKAGIDSYLSVLVAQRSLYGAQQNLVSVRMARMTNLVTLYKVLGGGA
jgi:multidrug efflux system outer membrane protein